MATQQSTEPSYLVIRHNGLVTPFDATKIMVALTKAFLAVEGNSAAASRRVHDIVANLTEQIVTNLMRRADMDRTFHLEDIQNQGELALMRGEYHKVARAYVLYREQHAKERAKASATVAPPPSLHVKTAERSLVPLDAARLPDVVGETRVGLAGVSVEAILTEMHRNLYNGISPDELALAAILAAAR